MMIRNKRELDAMFRRAREIAEQNTGMPAYLCDDEDWYAAVAQARAEHDDTEKAPMCPHCGDVAPYGDERNLWIWAHDSYTHAFWQRLKARWRRYFYPL